MKKNRFLFLLFLGIYPQASYTTFPNEEYRWQTSQTEETFWGKHKNKVIGGAILGSPLLIYLAWCLTNRGSSSRTEMPHDSHPPHVAHEQRAQEEQRYKQKEADDDARKAAKKAQPQKAEGDAGVHKKAEVDTGAHKEEQGERALEAIYYQLDPQEQKKSFDALWKACKEEIVQKKNLKEAFYKKFVGDVPQAAMDSESNKHYAYHNFDVGNKTNENIPKPKPPFTFQEAQEKFQATYGSDLLTPFDNYEIALNLQTKGITGLEDIYKAVKECIEKNKGDGFLCPDFGSLKNHPELLTVTSEIRMLITYLAKKDEYKNSKTLDLYKLGLWIRKNPDASLDRVQRTMLSTTNIPLEQAKKIILKACGQATSQAYQQTVIWLDKEVAKLTLAMEQYFLNNNPAGNAFTALVESCRDEQAKVFKQNLFNNAFAQAQEVLKAHQEEPAYTTWYAAMQGIEGRVNDSIKVEEEAVLAKAREAARQKTISELALTMRDLISVPKKEKEQLSGEAYEEQLRTPFSKLNQEDQKSVIKKVDEHWKTLWCGSDFNNNGIPEDEPWIRKLKYITINGKTNVHNYGSSVIKLFNEFCPGWYNK